MSVWSQRRKYLYSAVIGVVVVGAVIVPAFLYFYKAPTCFDGIQNGNELGIDCGGSCEKLCPTSFFTPVVAWKRVEEVGPHTYNVAAYIINKNTDQVGAPNVPYHFVLYDAKGVPVADARGTVTIPPRRNTLAFNFGVKTGSAVPVGSFFEFTGIPNWVKENDPLMHLVIGTKNYSEDDSGAYLQVTLENTGVLPITNVAVSVVLYDKDGNALGFSRTIVDEIPAQGSAVAPFTWPLSFHGAVISQEVLPVAE